MDYTIELELETDGRWIADVVNLPGVMVYAATRDLALAKAQALALRVEAEKLEKGQRKEDRALAGAILAAKNSKVVAEESILKKLRR